jgi:hypothetical protein
VITPEHWDQSFGKVREIRPQQYELLKAPAPGDWLRCKELVMPSWADVKTNAEEARAMGPDHSYDLAGIVFGAVEFYQKVKKGSDWDYKKYSEDFESFGNYNFGRTAASFGWDREFAHRMAGLFQERSRPEWGSPFRGAPYGDDPCDYYWIDKGYDDFRDSTLRSSEPRTDSSYGQRDTRTLA